MLLLCVRDKQSEGTRLSDSANGLVEKRHAGGDEDRRGVLGFRSLREFVRKMGRRGRPEVLALQLPQGPEQLTVTNLGPASKLLQEGGQERVTLQHIQRVCGSDHLPLLRIRELEGQGQVP